jgi:hypothetical protein
MSASIPVFLHRSHDGNASAVSGFPQLTGQVGAGIALLDAVLVNGYNLKTVQGITRSGNTATLTFSSGHGFIPYQPVVIAGADQSDYNGQFVVQSVPDSTHLTITVANNPATPATGASITCKAAPAGWTKVYSGTNLAVYQSADITSTRLYLRVDDTNAQYMLVKCYVSMSDVNTGTENFNGTHYWKKSNSADSVVRQSFICASSKFLHFGHAWADTAGSNPQYDLHQAGDFNTYTIGDAYNYLICGASSNPGSKGQQNQNLLTLYFNGDTNLPGAQMVARSYNQQVNTNRPIRAQSACPGNYSGADSNAYASNPSMNGVNFVPVYLYEYDANAKNSLRGAVPGLAHVIEYLPSTGTDGTSILAGVSGVAGGTLLLFNTNMGGTAGKAALDVLGGSGGFW